MLYKTGRKLISELAHRIGAVSILLPISHRTFRITLDGSLDKRLRLVFPVEPYGRSAKEREYQLA